MSSNIQNSIQSNKNNQEQAAQLRSRNECNKYSCDVTLIAGMDGRRIFAHRTILANNSDYFSAMFSGKMLEATQKRITLKQLHGDQLLPLVMYCYTGNISITEENAQDLMITASFLQIGNVADMCASFLQKNLSAYNSLGIAAFAEVYCRSLQYRADSYICEHFEEVCQSREFLELDVDKLSKLIANSDLNVSSEEPIFRSVMKWIEYNPKERSANINMLMKSVRLMLLPIRVVCSDDPIFQQFGCNDQLLENAKMSTMSLPRKGNSGLLALFSGSSMQDISVERYSPQLDMWRPFAKLPSARYVFATAVWKKQLLILGGCNSDDDKIVNTVDCYDFDTETYEQLAPMLAMRQNFGAAVVDGFVYAVGGISEKDVTLSTVERYNPATNSWKLVAPMMIPKYGAAVAALDGKLYVCGGSDGDGVNTKTTQYFDPVLNQWTLKANMKWDRRIFGLTANKGKLYAVGGFQSQSVNIIERYDPRSNEWSEICIIHKNPRQAFCAFLSGDRLMTVCSNMKYGKLSLEVANYNTKTDVLKYSEYKYSPLKSQNTMFFGLCAVVAMP